jgi:RNA polymerase sigma factor for flagellar operon FliA
VAEDTSSLWRDFRDDPKDKRTRDRLILTYAPLVKYVAGRLGSGLPAHVDEGDLVSYGLLGLIGAIERFDPSRDIKFETYAISRIKGAIIDELRSLDWVPRSVRSRAREIERAVAELEKKLMRAPTDEEISAKIGISVDELDTSLTEISRSSIAALDELWTVNSSGGDQVALIDTIEDTEGPEPQSALAQTEQKEALADAISRLPEREKLVVTLYYYEELTLREIGEVLGVTESRVSQLHTKAILRLKARLGGAVARAGRDLGIPTPVNTVFARVLDDIAHMPQLWAKYRERPQALCAEVEAEQQRMAAIVARA